MAQNVTIAGNQYPDVPSILVPKTGGGGNAIFADPSVVTAVAADVASGKYFLDSSGVLTQGTASGGGGASNIVTGTFTGATTDTAKEITLNYSGNGYPVAVVIYPTEGPYNSSTGTFYNLIQRYATQTLLLVKDKMTAPSYTNSGEDDNATVINRSKGSTSSATNYNVSASSGIGAYQQGIAVSSAYSRIVRFSSKTKMSVRIADTSYGFAANIEYTYWVIYSS